MFTSVFFVPDVGTVSLYLWAMSSSIQGISVFIRASILVIIFIIGSVAKRNIGMFLSFRVFWGWGRGRREVQNDIKPMMNPILSGLWPLLYGTWFHRIRLINRFVIQLQSLWSSTKIWSWTSLSHCNDEECDHEK
jgi:hypothetical protein